MYTGSQSHHHYYLLPAFYAAKTSMTFLWSQDSLSSSWHINSIHCLFANHGLSGVDVWPFASPRNLYALLGLVDLAQVSYISGRRLSVPPDVSSCCPSLSVDLNLWTEMKPVILDMTVRQFLDLTGFDSGPERSPGDFSCKCSLWMCLSGFSYSRQHHIRVGFKTVQICLKSYRKTTEWTPERLA